MTSQEVGAWALNLLKDFAVFFALGLLVIWLIPKPLHRWAEKVRQSPFKSFGAGIAVLIVGYIGIVIIFALILALGIFFYAIKLNDLGGIVIGLGLPASAVAFGALNLVVAFLSKLVIAFLFGLLLFERFFKKGLAHNIWPLLLGVVIYLLIRSIPLFGWIFGSIVTLVGLGGIWLGLLPVKKQEPVEGDAPAEAAPEVITAESESAPEEAAPQDTEAIASVESVDVPESNAIDQPAPEALVEAEAYADPDPQSGD